VATTIDRSASDVYEYVSDPTHLSEWAAGLAHAPVERVDDQWVVDSPLGRVVVEFAPANRFGITDHAVTLPDGTTVHNPMRVIANADGCDVVFSVRRQPGMNGADFDADVAAVRTDLDTLRSLLERS
jgi:hypothetical protein